MKLVPRPKKVARAVTSDIALTDAELEDLLNRKDEPPKGLQVVPNRFESDDAGSVHKMTTDGAGRARLGAPRRRRHSRWGNF